MQKAHVILLLKKLSKKISIIFIFFVKAQIDNSNMKFYSVEKLLGRRFNETTNEYEYKVKWSGYKMEDSTWEPLSSLGKAMGLVK